MIWLVALAPIIAFLFGIWRQDKLRQSARMEALLHEKEALEVRAALTQQKLKALSDSSGAGIVILTNQGVVVHINHAAEQVFGLEPDSLAGHSLIQATLSNELQDFVLAAIQEQKPRSRDFKLAGASGRIFRVSIFPFAMGLAGEPESMLVLVDMTELKKLETIRRDFVANVSHELRTPLTSIRAMAETLQDGALHDEEVAMGFLNTIVNETDRLARISKDLLILSDAESKPPERVRFDFAELVRDVVNRVATEAQDSEITLAATMPETAFISASRDQIEQVVVNLVSNAIKYTPAGGRVNLELMDDGPMVTLSVADTGIGIMQEYLPRIFERFYRVDKARSRQSGGTGLGLAIVKNIVEAHGGEVRVISEFNRGSTFIISLPS
ncbi:MAG: sensor histidine kinase [Fimbriimonas sp.]